MGAEHPKYPEHLERHRVAVLLSGGVDSSVALRLLRDAGHDVTAFYLKIWLEDELAFLGECPWEEDLRYARAVCADAGVPLEVVPLQRQYHERVVSDAVEELRAGRTPSPDILCNRRVKFGAFVDHLAQAGETSFDRIASGHYARLARRHDARGDEWHLLKGVDPVKDQTYFLHRLDQEQLSRCLFPIGDIPKSEVRRLADLYGLPNRQRKDSQGICFLGKIRFDDFVRGYLGEEPGEIRDIDTERVLGQHRGLWFHTIGQRKGLGLGGGPWYVVAKDLESRTLFVSHADRQVAHRQDRFTVPHMAWIGTPPPEETPVEVKLRHGPRTTPARFQYLPDGGLDIRLEDSDPGLAAGQSAVLYDGERCLGGGVILPRYDLPRPA